MCLGEGRLYGIMKLGAERNVAQKLGRGNFLPQAATGKTLLRDEDMRVEN